MKRSLPALLLLLLVIGGCNFQTDPLTTDQTRQLLVQLEGKWEDASGYQEWWSEMENDTWLGEGLVIENGKLKPMEKLRIVKQDSILVYQATVAAQNDGKTIDFPMAAANDSMLVFENPGHDFPNRITYLFGNDNSLIVRVESFIDTSKYFVLKLNRIK